VVKALFSAHDAFGRWWNLWEVGPSGRMLGHWGRNTLKGDIGTTAPTSLCILDAMRGAVYSFHGILPVMMFCFTTSPKATD
jgi:hypothetical protein